MNATTQDGRLEMMGGLASMLGVKASPERLIGYVEATRDIPHELLAAGIRRVVTTWRYPDMPKPADIRAAVDAEQRDRQRLLEAPTSIGRDVVCSRCDDAGWVFVAERTDRAQPTVKRCSCYQTNPKLVQPKSYSEPEPERRRR